MLNNYDFPSKKYQIIYADPPWPIRWRGSDIIGKKPLAYPTMTIGKLCQLPVKTVVEDCSKLFMWSWSKNQRHRKTK